MPRVSALTRWNSSVVESRKNAIDYAALDHFRQEVLSQEEFYESSVRSFVKRCLQGCSGSIITYGAWGSGKSYTLGALDPQQLALDTVGSGAAGVLPRCTQQLYEWLGQGASVEITCVEVQGDDVVDLLDQRVGPAAFSLGPGGASAAQEPFARSAIAVAAAGAATGSRRKPLTLVVARSLTEALMTLKQAVANRQAFVTASRHSSSRTHAVFQLRWRNPAAPAAGGDAASTAMRAAPQASGGGVAAQRAYSAPPRASLPTGPTGSPVSAAAGSRLPPCTGPGPICTLTLVDTCSFCPLLPPKEGSAVKRSLLALSRVLTALQRRHALTLRESKLTRMLEGAVDQVLVLACLGGSGDEPTVQLAKMLQQGMSRDSDLRRSRRASSSDSTRVSAAWEAQPHSSVFSVSSVKIASGGSTGAVGAPPRPSTSATKCSSGGQAAGPLLGPSRSIFRSPASPPVLGYGARSVVATRTECSRPDSAEGGCASMGGVGADAGGVRGNISSSGGGTATDADAVAPHPLSSLEVSSSSSSPAASSRSGNDSGGGEEAADDAAAATAAAASPCAKAARPMTLTIDVHTDITDASASVSSDGGAREGGGGGVRVGSGQGRGGAAAATATAAHEKRLALPAGGGSAAAGRRPGSSIPSPQGTAGGVPLSRRMSPRLVSPRQKPSPVTARAAPNSEVRLSQGFSVLTGKWSPPPPVSPRASSFPIIPCLLMPHEGGSASSALRSSIVQAAAAANTDPAMSASGRQPCSSKPGTSVASVPLSLTAKRTAGSPAAGRGCGGSGATPRSVGAGSGNAGGGGGSVSPFAALVAATSTVDPPELTSAASRTSPAAASGSAAGGGSPASAVSTPTRRKSGIPTRTPVRSPQPLMPSPFAAAGVGPAASTPRSAHRPAARSPSPIGAATVVSLAAVRPTRLVSMRYGNANTSHDSVPDGVAAAASVPLDVAPAALARTPLRRQQTAAPSGVAVAALAGPEGVGVRSRPRESGALAAVKRSISSGLRWPSPLLRARRAEWLSDLRRSRSALPRPLSEMPEVAAGDAASPRRLRGGGFRCAVLGRPTLSAQYKDLLHVFEAFKARERQPRKRRSAHGSAAPPMTSVASAPPASTTLPLRSPAENPSPARPYAADAAAPSPAAPRLQDPVPAPKPGTSTPRTRGVASATALSSAPSPSSQQQQQQQGLTAPASSPAASTGLPATGRDSPVASISTPRSARPASGGCVRLPPAFSRAHSPSADEGLLSLTAAAAVVAASPRTPVSGSALPSGRPRPGVSRAGGPTASPRPLRSPENPVTPVSPVMVLDMSRLYAGKGSPAAAAPLSGRSRFSASSVNAAATAAGVLASGGSDRYRRLVEQDPDSDRISEVGPDPDLELDRGHSDAGSDPSAGLDSDQDNLLGPGCLGHLGLMLNTGGDVAALRNSISKLGDSCRASPAVAAGGAAATAASPSPLRRTAAAAAASAAAAAIAAEAAAVSGYPSDGDPDEPDEELPAVSFFICQFTPRVEVGGGAAAEEQRPAAACVSRAPCAAGSAAVVAGPHAEATTGTASETRQLERVSADSRQLDPEARGRDVAGAGVPQLEPQPELEEPPQQQPRRRRSPGREMGVNISAAAVAAPAAAELQLSYALQDRASVESGVLRGSCTPFAVDCCGDEAIAAEKSSAGGHAPPWQPPSSPPAAAPQPHADAQDQDREPQPRAAAEQHGSRDWAAGPGEAPRSRGRIEGPAVPPPSESCISLRQLLEQQELLLLQQRLGRRTAGLAASPGAPAPVGGQEAEPGQGGVPSAALAASALLAQLAHVRPNHVDLDEQSNVLVDVDSASESDVAADAARRVPASALHGSGPGSATTPAVRRRGISAAASPPMPSAPLPELPPAIRAPSPVKPLHSPSPAQSPLNLSQKSSGRARMAALDASTSPMAVRAGATARVVHSWAHNGSGDGGSGHRSPADAVLAAAAAATAQGGAADGARRGSAQARSSPSPASTVVAKAVAAVERRAVSGSGPVPQCRAAPINAGAGHARHPSDSAVGGGGISALGSQAIPRHGSLGRTAAVAVSPPPSPPPPPPLPITRSIESDGAVRQPLLLPPTLPLHQQPQQQLHIQLHHPPPQAQQQQPLRGSGNVAAAWRAAAAKSTSSSSSVRSCFRSNSGQQQQQQPQQQQQHSMLGSDATAVATVVALSRAPPACCDDKHHSALANATGYATAIASISNTAAKLSGSSERLSSAQSSGSTAAAAGAPATAAAIAPPSAIAAIAAAPPLPPGPPAAPNPFSMRSVSPGPVPAPYAPPPALPPQPQPAPQPPAPEARSAPTPFAALLAKAKSARGGERPFPLTARLRACKSQRTPRASGAAAAGGSGGVAAPPLEEVVEEPPPPPPSAYPPGFVTWATRLFSGSRKSKQPS